MFEISDVLIDKEEVAMTLNIHLELPETAETEESHSISEHGFARVYPEQSCSGHFFF